MRRLPPLNALRAFEAAARHLSFSKAAEELNVTPAAVSHQVKSLEEFFGIALFRRLPRQVLLTEEGMAALPLMSEGFDRLADAADQLVGCNETGLLTVTSSPTFAAKWLVPRLPRFGDRYPDINVRLDTTLGVLDYARDGIDVAIRLGPGDYPGMRVDRVFHEVVVPVCSPALRDGPKPLRTPEDLAHHTLLHVDWGALRETSPDWRMWLMCAGVEGVDPTRGPAFTVEDLAISAAIDGNGVALASTHAVANDLKAGRLVKPFELALPTDFCFWVVAPEKTADRPKVAAFRDWLLAEAAASQIEETTTVCL